MNTTEPHILVKWYRKLKASRSSMGGENPSLETVSSEKPANPIEAELLGRLEGVKGGTNREANER